MSPRARRIALRRAKRTPGLATYGATAIAGRWSRDRAEGGGLRGARAARWARARAAAVRGASDGNSPRAAAMQLARTAARIAMGPRARGAYARSCSSGRARALPRADHTPPPLREARVYHSDTEKDEGSQKCAHDDLPLLWICMQADPANCARRDCAASRSERIGGLKPGPCWYRSRGRSPSRSRSRSRSWTRGTRAI